MDFIYALGSPITGDIYYVGRTAKPSQRGQHCKCRRTTVSLDQANTHILRLVLKPVMLILERDAKEPAKAEKHWITCYANAWISPNQRWGENGASSVIRLGYSYAQIPIKSRGFVTKNTAWQTALFLTWVIQRTC